MRKEFGPNYNQLYLFPERLEDWLPTDHPARFIREFVEHLDLASLGLWCRQSPRGQTNYSQKMMLQLWLYAWMQKYRSSRMIERACRENIPFIWLTGMTTPDHTTIWRFFKRNKTVLKKLFKEVVRIAQKANLIGFVLHAVDGTKIMSRASTDHIIRKQDITFILEQLDSLADEIVSETESHYGDDTPPGDRLPPGLSNPQELRQFISKTRRGLEHSQQKAKTVASSVTASQKQALKNAVRVMKEKRTSSFNVIDKDSTAMRCNEGKKFGYNAQIVVDGDSSLIVGETVINDGTDNHQAVAMLDEVKENTGHVADETVLDNGYYSGDQLHQAEKKGYSVLISENNKSKDDFHQSHFHYDVINDEYTCPQGQKLTYECTKRIAKKKKYTSRVYRCHACSGCPSQDKCTIDKQGRTIKRSPYVKSMERQHKKQQAPANKTKLRQRKAIVEPRFGFIKENLGFRRWSVFGLAGVQAQWSLQCTVYNIYKLYQLWRRGVFNLAMCRGGCE